MNTTDRDTLDTFDEIRYGLLGSGYTPIDTPDVGELLERIGNAPLVLRTVAYFAARGWDAVRILSDSIQFARFDDEGGRLMSTTLSGCISTEARFTLDRLGRRMFTESANLLP